MARPGRRTSPSLDRFPHVVDYYRRKEQIVGPSAWDFYQSNVRAHDLSFDQLLGRLGFTSFRRWFKKRQADGLSTHILDVMGGHGAFLRDLNSTDTRFQKHSKPRSDASLVVTLVDHTKKTDMAKANRKLSIDILTGDINSCDTWQAIGGWMRDKEVPAFDMVVSRGAGGVKTIPIEHYGYLLNRMYELTTAQGGLILAQVGSEAELGWEKWQSVLNSVPGITMYTQDGREENPYRPTLYYWVAATWPAVAILKRPEAPPSLQSITDPLDCRLNH